VFDRSFNWSSFDAHDGQVLCCHAVPLSNDRAVPRSKWWVLAGCVEHTDGHDSVWIDTSFACGCSCSCTPCMCYSILSTQSSAGSAGATVWIATSFRPHPCVFVHTLAWSNDDPLKDLSNTRALKHLATLATDYWDSSHSFVEPGHSCVKKLERIWIMDSKCLQEVKSVIG